MFRGSLHRSAMAAVSFGPDLCGISGGDTCLADGFITERGAAASTAPPASASAEFGEGADFGKGSEIGSRGFIAAAGRASSEATLGPRRRRASCAFRAEEPLARPVKTSLLDAASLGRSCRRERACIKPVIRVWARVGPSGALAEFAPSACFLGLIVFGAGLIVYRLVTWDWR
jgi:hypothetical protein